MFLLFLLASVVIVAVVVIMATIVIVRMIVVVRMADVMVVRMVVVVAMIVTVIMVMIMVMVMVAFATAFVVMIVIVIVFVFVFGEHGVEVFGEGLFGDAINLADRNAAFGGELCAGLEFRREQRAFAVSPAELAVKLSDRRFDDARLPSTLRALHQRTADAERRGLGEDDVFHLV